MGVLEFGKLIGDGLMSSTHVLHVSDTCFFHFVMWQGNVVKCENAVWHVVWKSGMTV